MKSRIQIIVGILALLVLIYGCYTILEAPTMILPSWYILIVLAVVVLSASLGVGALVKAVFKLKWSVVTLSLSVAAIFCLVYLGATSKPTCTVVVKPGYSGEVRLFVSKSPEGTDKIILNDYGVGYIDQEKFEKGFTPVILKENDDITGEVKEYRKNTFTSTSFNGSLNYLSFDIPGGSGVPAKTMDELIELNAVDTNKIGPTH
ncbi:hypothetical protein [Hufsiella ginkgonis]|uniref:Uncharacterized protein n=1 Tax=Hufsiella ginkgonis TaxID=2695274 RepID=A0A7K1XXF9_9SPHI|nr:hypothetical protein [Hufsiella ginkgonis]MXV15623.1 hypothetical protein [Hufsiella ginkgonis]